jgi:hypothetical protein
MVTNNVCCPSLHNVDMRKNCSPPAILIALDSLSSTTSIENVCHPLSLDNASNADGFNTSAIVNTSSASLHTRSLLLPGFLCSFRLVSCITEGTSFEELILFKLPANAAHASLIMGKITQRLLLYRRKCMPLLS